VARRSCTGRQQVGRATTPGDLWPTRAPADTRINQTGSSSPDRFPAYVTDTRKDARLKVLLFARYREPAQDVPVEGECRDLSPSGMYIMTPSPSSPGALIRFECTSEVAGSDFSGTGRVV